MCPADRERGAAGDGAPVLRYHHLLCLPRFVGEGYSDSFCANMAKVKAWLLASPGPLLSPDGSWNLEGLHLVEGPDMVCAACPNLVDGVCSSQEKVARYDAAVRHHVQQGRLPLLQDVCRDCSWFELCRSIEATW